MDSISSIAKNHCYCGSNIICGLLLVLLAALNIFQAVLTYEPIYIVGSVFFALMALFSWIYIPGFKVGCTLIKIPLVIITVINFVIAIFTISIGILFVNNGGVENYINSLLSQYGYILAVDAQLIGISLIFGGILFFGFSFCLLAGIRYFDSIKSCLNGEVKRIGARLFGISSIIIFVIISVIEITYIVFLILSNQFSQIISIFSVQMLCVKLILVDLLLLFIGISANTFANRTYEFKIMENQMMKIESNADGTVYVPINDEFEFSYYGSNNAAKSSKADSKKRHKPFIKEGQVIQNSNESKKDRPIDEKNII